jgi:uncharacterized membrane protein
MDQGSITVKVDMPKAHIKDIFLNLNNLKSVVSCREVVNAVEAYFATNQTFELTIAAYSTSCDIQYVVVPADKIL